MKIKKRKGRIIATIQRKVVLIVLQAGLLTVKKNKKPVLKYSKRVLMFNLKKYQAIGAAAKTSADTPEAYFSKFFTNKPARYFAFSS